jgi:2-polyprenyl-6-hydroxyphenyl methylase/3-demethylubiquinone-9 3-methyltransferase
MPRVPTSAEFAHEDLGARFDSALSLFDTRRRVEVLVDEFLSDAHVVGKSVLDVGCGLGFFSERLVQRGARVTACDIGPQLVERTRQRARCDAIVADAMTLAEHFGPNRFDGVVSSECVEHTPDPREALKQMIAVVKPGGFLSVSTPNVVWQPVVSLATVLGLRPFTGLENFSSWAQLRKALSSLGAPVTIERGLHLFPFQLPFHSLSLRCDRHLQCLRAVMINMCVLAFKRQQVVAPDR